MSREPREWLAAHSHYPRDPSCPFPAPISDQWSSRPRQMSTAMSGSGCSRGAWPCTGAFCTAQVPSCACVPACKVTMHLCLTNCCARKGPGVGPRYPGPRWGPQELPCMHSPSAALLAVVLQHCVLAARPCKWGCKWFLAVPKLRVSPTCAAGSGGWAGVSLSWLCCMRLPSPGRGVWIPADALNGEVTFSCENFYVSSEDRS